MLGRLQEVPAYAQIRNHYSMLCASIPGETVKNLSVKINIRKYTKIKLVRIGYEWMEHLINPSTLVHYEIFLRFYFYSDMSKVFVRQEQLFAFKRYGVVTLHYNGTQRPDSKSSKFKLKFEAFWHVVDCVPRSKNWSR